MPNFVSPTSIFLSDNHTIAVVKMSESHEMLAATLSPVLDEVKGLMKSRKIQVGRNNT